jgi:rhomboid protease GluP
VCRNCGALIGAGEPTCAMCGAPSVAAGGGGQEMPPVHHPAHDRDAINFARAILTRPAPFTIVLLVANIFVFTLTALAAKSTGDNAAFYNMLVAYGGKVNALIRAGEWWRFVTPIFLHGDIIHLLMNMYGLWVLGPYVERLYGSAKFVFFWVVTGVAGVLASYLTVRPGMQLNAASRFLFKNVDAVSVGASGALFGLIGVLFVFGIKFRHELPDGFKRAFGTGMLPTIMLNVFIGLTIPVIDNAAHMGGMLAGAALALVVSYKRPGERQSVAVFWHVLQVAALALVALSFTMVATHFKASTAQSGISNDGQPDIQAFIDALNGGQTALYKAVNEQEESGVEGALKKLDDAPSLGERADALRGELRALLVRAQALAKAPPNQSAKARLTQRLELVKDAEAWLEKRDQWVKSEGEQYGIKVPDAEAKPEDATPPDKSKSDKK